LNDDGTAIDKARCVVSVVLNPNELLDALSAVAEDVDSEGVDLELTETIADGNEEDNDDDVLGHARNESVIGPPVFDWDQPCQSIPEERRD